MLKWSQPYPSKAGHLLRVYIYIDVMLLLKYVCRYRAVNVSPMALTSHIIKPIFLESHIPLN